MNGREASMFDRLLSLLQTPAVGGTLLVCSILLVLASLVLVPWFLARLPKDYLHADKPPHASLPLRVLKNVLGVVLVVLGIAMLLLPGQGVLTLLVGVLLVDFPGKQALVRRLLGRPKVLKLVNKLRHRRGAEPLEA
jgi:Na+/H+ antiporter NhaD/arsenite permease-like protein